MFAAIDTILSVAKELFGVVSRIKESKAERRQRIASYLETISHCTAEISSDLRRGESPSARCSELATYADMLPQVLGDELGRDESAELARKLKEAGHARRLAMELANAKDEYTKEAQFQKLEEASGLLLAMANTVRAL